MTLQEALVEFRRGGGTAYTVLRSLAGGEVGAVEAIDPDGARVVAKWQWPADSSTLGQLRFAVGLVDRLRSRGVPLPAYLVVEGVGDGVLVIQQRMPGTAGDVVGIAMLEDLVAVNAVQERAVIDGSGWKDYVCRSLMVGLEGYCEHASLRTYSRATRALLARARTAGAALGSVDLIETDAVHLDFHHRNALSRDGRVSAVIDCEGYRSGDRVFDLVTLAFGLAVAKCPAHAVRHLWQRIRAERSDAIVEAYITHHAIRQVDWSIRHRTPADVAAWLDRSQELTT